MVGKNTTRGRRAGGGACGHARRALNLLFALMLACAMVPATSLSADVDAASQAAADESAATTTDTTGGTDADVEVVDQTSEGADALAEPEDSEGTGTGDSSDEAPEATDDEDAVLGGSDDAVNVSSASLTGAPLVTSSLYSQFALMAASLDPLPSDSKTSADGATIESISVEWITSDTTDDGDASRLSLAPSDDTAQQVRMRLNFALSGKTDWGVGDVEIAVPKTIFTYRDGSTAGTMTLSVPEAPDTRATFAYTDMGDYYLISNTKKLTAATNAMFEFTVKGITPHLINGNPSSYVSDDFMAQISATTPEGTLLQKESNSIDCTIDTSEKVSSASNRVNSVTSDNEYVYVDWYSYAWPSGNQSYSISVKHDISLSGVTGEIYQMTGASSTSGTSASATLSDNTYTTTGYSNHYVHLYARFPKSAFMDGAAHVLTDTVTYTLTDLDDKTTTTATATASTTVQLVPYTAPDGHFAVGKSGVAYSSGRVSNANLNYSGYQDYYGGFLNRLEGGTDVDLRYYVTTTGYGAPWTYKDLDGDDTQDEGELGQYSYTMDTYDSTVNLVGVADQLKAGDYSFTQLQVSSVLAYDWKQGDVFSAWNYVSKPFTGTIELYATVNGSETHVATLSYTNGALTATCENGASATGSTITLPAGATGWHSTVTTKEAGVVYSIQPTVRLSASSDTVAAWVDELFENSDTPQQTVTNTATATISFENGSASTTLDAAVGTDYVTGAAQAANVTKSLSYENDTSNSQVKLHYTATTRNQSNITDADEYDQLVDDGVLTEETGGTFYDLLPLDVFVDVDSVKATRSGDAVASVKTYENYKDSGRTLLVVKLDEEPNKNYASGTNSLTGYGESHGISFDAVYSWESMSQHGTQLDNVVSYESGNTRYGTVKGYAGEPDDPTYGNANASKSAVSGVEDVMTNLDADRDDPSFVYGRASNTLSVDVHAVIDLHKKVAVNGTGEYGDGQGNYPLNVYEGGTYTYRLTQTNATDAAAKDIVFYDALEQYVPTASDADHGDVQWKGTLASIDLSSLQSAGAAPVVYYSTKSGIELMDQDSDDFDLSDTGVWSTTKPADASTITGIAIDCRKDADGNDFVLAQGETMSAYITMNAPTLTEEQQKTYYDTDLQGDQTEGGDSGATGGAHAYNAVSMKATTIASSGAEGTKSQFFEQHYTKVGMTPYEVKATKTWSDDSNRDGKRADSVTLHLYADGVDTGKTVTLSSDNEWTDSFGTVAKYADGQLIAYTVVEDKVDGYTYRAVPTTEDEVTTFEVTNTHEPEKISLSGTKVWDDDDNAAGDRPSSVTLTLYKNGVKYKSMDVAGDSTAESWSWSFDNLFKYEKGQEIAWTVSEDAYYAGYKAGVVDATAASGSVTVTNERYPYGDLKVSKAIKDATDASKGKEFTLTLYVKKADGEPDAGTYKYVRTAADGTETEGEVAQGGTFTIKGGETVVVKDIPSECTYELVEADAAGWTLTGASGRTGSILAGRVSEAALTNTYDATGAVQLAASKTLTGREASGGLEARQFTFTVTDSEGNVVRRTTNAADGSVTFGRISYGLEDIGTHTYTIAEVIPDDAQAYDANGEAIDGVTWGTATADQKAAADHWTYKGYTYDASAYTAKVTVTDNGDGTLSAKTVYSSATGSAVDGAAFANEYEATGSITPKAWKQLNGQDLSNGQFTFTLTPTSGTDADGDAVDVSKIPVAADATDRVMTATNDAEGTITWSDIPFTQADAGNTYIYTAKEVKGTDDSVDYSEQEFSYIVKVVDNGDGTLSFNAEVKGPIEGTVTLSGNTEAGGTLTANVSDIQDDIATADIYYSWYVVDTDGTESLVSEGKGDEYASYTTASDAAGKSVICVVKDGSSSAPHSGTIESSAVEIEAHVDVKYAVQLLGIGVDEDTAGNTLGLSFGPATGADYVSTYKACSGKTSGCIHYDSWSTIIANASSNPHIYDDCLTNGCTKSVNLDFTDKAVGSGYYHTVNAEGDGDGTLPCIKEAYSTWNGTWSTGGTGAGGWAASLIRRTLNGSDACTDTALNSSNTTTPLTSDQALISCFPSELKNAIVAKAVKTRTVCNDASSVAATADKLWLLSYDEIWGSNLGEGTQYSSRFSSAGLTAYYNDTAWSWWLRSLDTGTFSGNYAYYVMSYGSRDLNPVNYTTKSLAPCFCLGVAGSTSNTTTTSVDSGTTTQTSEAAAASETTSNEATSNEETTASETTTSETTSNEETTASGTSSDEASSSNDVSAAGDTSTVDDTSSSGTTTTQTITLKGNQSATLSGIPAGTTYTVYEETPAGWVEVASSGASGTVEANQESTATFTNEYVTGETQATITATKTVDEGTDVDAGAYSFTLKDSSGTTLQTVANAAGGGIVFTPIKYTEAGTYTYTISEVVPASTDAAYDASITYDTHTCTATVTVSDDGAGNLTASVAYSDPDDATNTSPQTFDNTTKTEYKYGSISITKAVTGTTTRTSDEFTFNVDINGGLTNQTVTLKAGETKTISELPVGATYEVTETSMPDGYSQVSLTNASGTVKADAEDGVTVTATNSYSATGSFAPTATKTLSGGDLTEGQFTFNLYESNSSGTVATDAQPVSTGSSSASGAVSFTPVEVTQTGTYYYVMREVAEDATTYVYDSHDSLVQVVVTDGDAGEYKCAVTYPSSDNTFANSVRPGTLTITKSVENKTSGITDKSYEIALSLKDADGASVADCAYTVTDASGSSVSTGSVSDGGAISLKDGQTATITVPGNTTYEVSETAYDGFTTTYEGEEGTVTPSGTAVATVTNTYSLTPTEFAPAVEKSYVGGTLSADMFTFELRDENGSVLETKSNDADGKVAFSAFALAAEDGASATYTIREVDDGNEDIRFDGTVVTVKVTTKDNGDGTMTASATYSDGASTSAAKASGEVGWVFNNVRLFSMPAAGAAGVAPIVCAAAALLLASALWVFRRRLLPAFASAGGGTSGGTDPPPPT